MGTAPDDETIAGEGAKEADRYNRLACYFAEGGRGTHGTSQGYDYGCRCDPCRLAHNEKSRAYKRARRIARDRPT